ncbi:EI24 domain-containing protein [Terrimonas alba]|uniref:EI24 domain-containing protein n=1 Tax=Terrimonas alba TaxID=3349636 RepID=UPI0035F2B602
MLKEIVITIQSWTEAHRFISQHKLWKWVVIPGLIYTILFIAAMYFFGKSATAVIEYITHILQLSNWIQKFENSFLGFLFTFTGVILWLVLLLFYFSFFKYICLIIGSPVFAYLSRKTEFILENNDHSPNWPEIKSEAARGVYIAMRNCFWQTVYLVGLILLCLVPVVGWITPLIVLVVECYYFGFSMLDYGFARAKYSTSQSIQFIGKHKGLAITNGFLFYLMHLVILFAPAYAIIAATLTVRQVKTT